MERQQKCLQIYQIKGAEHFPNTKEKLTNVSMESFLKLY